MAKIAFNNRLCNYMHCTTPHILKIFYVLTPPVAVFLWSLFGPFSDVEAIVQSPSSPELWVHWHWPRVVSKLQSPLNGPTIEQL